MHAERDPVVADCYVHSIWEKLSSHVGFGLRTKQTAWFFTLLVVACAPTSAVDENNETLESDVRARQAHVEEVTWICGNGLLDAGEACDDGNRVPGDGCDATCTISAGFECGDGSPSYCSPICGDGLVVGDETCDDVNDLAGDGCLGCQTERGYTCTQNVGGETQCTALCGDGIILQRAGEACDDGNLFGGDGCSASCEPEPGFCCDPAAGYCIPQSQFSSEMSSAIEIVDGEYDGTLDSMSCIEVEVTSPGSCNFGSVDDMRLELSIDHPRVGELTIKLMSPSGLVTTLASIPGYDEPVDGGASHTGAQASLMSSAPIVFDDGEQDAVSAEHMGAGIGAGDPVCLTDGRCAFIASPGAGVGVNGLDDFHQEPAAGTWTVCVGDSSRGHVGTLVDAELTYRAM